MAKMAPQAPKKVKMAPQALGFLKQSTPKTGVFDVFKSMEKYPPPP